MLKKFKIYKLKFASPLHLNSSFESDDLSKSEVIAHSDMLKSALFSTAAILKPELQRPNEGEKFFESFIISSAFPYYDKLLFLPKPKGKLPLSDKESSDSNYDFKKKLKKISYIDFDLFFELYGKKISDLFLFDEKNYAIFSNLLIHSKHKNLFISDADKENKSFNLTVQAIQERVYIRKPYEVKVFEKRGSKSFKFSDPFIIERIYFKEKAGLYFILEYENDNFDLNFFELTLKTLGEFGIGTDRNVGNGQFVIESSEERSVEVDENSQYVMNLSLYLPTKEEVEKFTENAQYKLLLRGGWISNIPDLFQVKKHEIKKYIYMIEEASAFERNYTFKGKIENLKPDNSAYDHPVWRDGRSIFLPINNVN